MNINRFKVQTPPTNRSSGITNSKLSLFDRNNSDKNMFNLVDEEIIKLSGSEVHLFKYYPSEDYDEVYQESRKKVIAAEPIILYGHYEPKALEENLTQFGVEVDNDQVFVFNKTYVEELVGRPIIIGDILKPSFQNMKFEVFEVQEDSFEAYGIYHLLVHAKLLRDTEDIHKDNLFNRSEDLGDSR